MILVLASLLCLVQEVPAGELAVAPQPPLPAGTELRWHDAAVLSGHAELELAVAALSRSAQAPLDAAAAEEFARITELRRAAEERAEGLALTMGARLGLVDGQRIAHFGAGRLALLGTPAQQARLTTALSQAAGFTGMVEVEARLYFATEAELPALAFGQGLVLGEVEARKLREAVERSSKEIVSAPLVWTHPWRKTQLSTLDQVPYVKDYEITKVPGLDAEILDPVIGVLDLGVEIGLRCAPADGNRLGLLAELTHRRLRAPLREFETTIGSAPSSVTIQLADVATVGFEGYFELGEGETLVLAGGSPEERVVVLMHARRVAEAR